MRKFIAVALCATLGGCVTAETVSFNASNPQQQAMMRDGQPALVSRQKNSIVLVRPAARQLQANGRPVFIVGINNIGRQPVEFRVSQVEAAQHVGASDYEMQIVTYEMLVQERPYNVDRLNFEWGTFIERGRLSGRSKHQRRRAL